MHVDSARSTVTRQASLVARLLQTVVGPLPRRDGAGPGPSGAGVPLDGQHGGKGNLDKIAAVVHEQGAGVQVGRGEAGARGRSSVQGLGQHGMCRPRDHECGSPPGKAPGPAHRVESADREREQQAGKEDMGLDSSV